jgi:hypothetical protein
MNNRFLISEEEKQSILNKHINATKKQYLTEQETSTPVPNIPGVTTTSSVTNNQKIAMEKGYGPRTTEDANKLASQGWPEKSKPQQTTQNTEQNKTTNNTTKTINTGTLGSYVKEAQKLLGMSATEQDGKFGPKTLAALKAKLGTPSVTTEPKQVTTQASTNAVSNTQSSTINVPNPQSPINNTSTETSSDVNSLN